MSLSGSSTRSHIQNALSYTVLLGGLATIVVTARMVIASYSPLFFWDSWEMVFAAARGENLLSWHWLWAQHNEHRLLIPKLLEVADLRWFQGRQAFLLVCIFAVQCLHLAVLGWSMRALGGWRGAAWRIGFGMAAFCLFCPSQWENLTWGFQLCFVLPLFFASVSFVGLLAGYNRRRHNPSTTIWPFLALSIFAALGANWSLANGILVWPLLVLAAFFLLGRYAALSYLIVGTLSSWLYLHAFVAGSEGGGPLAALRSPLRLLQYIATYLGSAWLTKGVAIAMVLGTAGLVAAAVVVFRYVRNFRLQQPFSLQLVLTVLFCLETSLVTALGRLNLGLEQAFSSRYQSVVLLFWFAMGALLLQPWLEKPESRVTVFAQVFLLVVMLRGALFVTRPLHEMRYRQFITDRAVAALLTNVNDPEALRYVYPRADMTWDGAQYLKARHLSIFSNAIEPATPLQSKFTIAPEYDCTGAVDSTVQVGDAQTGVLKVSGWAWDLRHHRAPLTVVAASDGLITGRFGIGAWLPLVRAAHRGITNSYIGFTGYVRVGATPATVKLYAILPGRPESACPIAEVDTSGGH